MRTLSDDELGPHLDALSAKFESWLAPKPPWTSSKMTAGRLDAMKKAIVGLVMTVEEIEGSFKLNQHKSDVDHAAVATRWHSNRKPPRGFWPAKCARCARNCSRNSRSPEESNHLENRQRQHGLRRKPTVKASVRNTGRPMV